MIRSGCILSREILVTKVLPTSTQTFSHDLLLYISQEYVTLCLILKHCHTAHEKECDITRSCRIRIVLLRAIYSASTDANKWQNTLCPVLSNLCVTPAASVGIFRRSFSPVELYSVAVCLVMYYNPVIVSVCRVSVLTVTVCLFSLNMLNRHLSDRVMSEKWRIVIW